MPGRPSEVGLSEPRQGSADVPRAAQDRAEGGGEPFVGRDAELGRLDSLFGDALRGEGHIALVSEEAGAGKTALLRAFVSAARRRDASWTYCRARCAAQYGPVEAYLPFLEGLGNLLLGPARERTARLLRQYAPTWCLQLPASGLPESARELTIGATKERMLREFGDVFEAASREAPLLGVIEDLQWADPSSLDLLRHVAHRAAHLRLLVIATFRPSELELSPAPVRSSVAELRLNGSCEELRLGPLGSEQIAAYFDRRFRPHGLPGEFLQAIEARTEGHPFFLASLAQHLVDQGRIVWRGERWQLAHPVDALELEAPEGVRELTRRRLEALPEGERAALECASVMGREFLSSVVARALGEDELRLEERLRRLERVRRLLYALGEEELPDGSLSTRYRFVNALYPEVLYDELLSRRRVALHARAGHELQRAYGPQAPRVASQLAVHFERGRDFAAASLALAAAGDNAAALYDAGAAARRYDEALQLVDKLPEAERAGRAVPLLQRRGSASMAMTRFEEAARHYARMLELARGSADPASQCAALSGLCNALFFSHRIEEMAVRAEQAWRAAEASGDARLQAEALLLLAQLAQEEGDLVDCRNLLEQALAVARGVGDRPLLLAAGALRGVLHYWQSEFSPAEVRLAEAEVLAHEQRDGFRLLLARRFLGLSRGNLGRISEARACFMEGIQTARRNGDQFWLPTFYNHLGWLHRELHDIAAAIEHDREGLRLARAHSVGEAESGALLNLGLDYTLAGELDRGLEFIEQSRAAAPRNWFEWFFELRLGSALALHWLARGEPRRAEQHAGELRRAAQRLGARVYVAAAHRLQAESLLAGGQPGAAVLSVEKARACLDGLAAPLEAWRVHELAARCCEASGQPGPASAARHEAAALVEAIAAATDEPSCRDSFLGSRPVRQLLEAAP
jgi:tetratricopeptide (TPR) repeat protein